MKLKYSIGNLLLLTAIVGILIAWQQDHKRMADDTKTQNKAVNHANMVAVNVICTSLDFTEKELLLVNEVRVDKALASFNLSKIDGWKTRYCGEMKKWLDSLNEESVSHDFPLDSKTVVAVGNVIKDLNRMAVPTAYRNANNSQIDQ